MAPLSLVSYVIAALLFLFEWADATFLKLNGHRVTAGLFFLALGFVFEHVVTVARPIYERRVR